MRSLVLALGLAAPACDWAFQLERAPVDGAVDTTVVLDPLLLIVTAAGPTTPVMSAERYVMPTPRVLFEDDTSPALTVEPDGTYTFDRATSDQPYQLILTSSQMLEVEIQLSTARVNTAERHIGRRTTMVPGAFLYFTYSHTAEPVPATGQSFLVTTGQWTETAGSPAISHSVEWRTARSLGAPVGVFSAAAGDHSYAAYHGKRTTSGTGGEYTVVTDVCTAAVQPEMATMQVTLTCDYAPATPSHCVHVTADRGAEDQRLQSVLVDPAAYFLADAMWSLLAPPSFELGPAPGLRLAYQTFAGGQPVFDGPVMYATPYPGHGRSLGMRVARARFVSLPGLGGVVITAATAHYTAPRADCSAPTVIPSVVAIPGTFVLGGTLLLADAMVSIDRAQDPVLTWTRAAPGQVDVYVVRLGELVDNGFGGTTHTVRRLYVTTGESLRISRDVLEPGHTYVLDVEAQLGYPDAASGDLRTLASGDAPIATANNFSGVFKVID